MAKSDFVRVFGAPLLLATLTTLGLISALVADGIWDAVSSLGLGAPVVSAAYLIMRQRRRHRNQRGSA
jgi:hypothetical protein